MVCASVSGCVLSTLLQALIASCPGCGLVIMDVFSEQKDYVMHCTTKPQGVQHMICCISCPDSPHGGKAEGLDALLNSWASQTGVAI